MMSKQQQVLRALRVGLVALCAMVVYEITKQIFFSRLSALASDITAVLFAGCVGFRISFIIRQREKAAQQELLRLAAIVQQSDDAIVGAELDGTVTSWNRGADLRARQCDEIQGYYFSKPLTVDEVADKLRGDYPEALVRAQANGGQS